MDFPGDLARAFPRLTRTNSRPTSPKNAEYNCIAWAADDMSRPWWPDKNGIGYWPIGVPREATLEAFVAAYETIGYVPCDNGDLEETVEKIAIYADADGCPTHAARQLKTGKWTSKLGSSATIDIEHDSPHDIAGNVYGQVVTFLKRARASA
jgi:hypothetical protein